MKSRSICFSDEEVNAVLDGRMTMFARPIKDQPEIKYGALYWTSSKYNNGMGVNYFHTKSVVGIMYAWKKACPFGVVGDQLWIKEVWGIVSEKRKEFEALPLFEYACPDCDSKNEWDQLKAMEENRITVDKGYHIAFRSGGLSNGEDLIYKNPYWRSPAIMPLWASRITLEIVDVKVKRISELSIGDIHHIGAPFELKKEWVANEDGTLSVSKESQEACKWFELYWNKRFKKYSYESNPWIWLVEFKGVKP